MKIGFRTIKTAIGAGFSLWLASLFGLEFYTTAATITILCIERTQKKSIQTALNRFFACTISLLLAWLVYETVGYHPLSFSLIIILLIPILIQLRLQQGFITSVVVPIHLLSLTTVNWSVVQNEFFVIIIGISVAMFLNLYMPNREKEVLAYKQEIEAHYEKVLYELATQLDKSDYVSDKSSLEALPKVLENAKTLAMDVSENSLWKEQASLLAYFEMREKQLSILERMFGITEQLSNDIPQRHIFADFMFQISNNINDTNQSPIFLKQLKTERVKMDKLGLPNNIEEMRNRATVSQLMYEMERYFETKIKYHQRLEEAEKNH